MKFSIALLVALFATLAVTNAYSSGFSSGYTSTTAAASVIKQKITMSGTVVLYTGNLKSLVEEAYGAVLGIFDTAATTPAYKTGCSMTSTAAAARRSNIKVSFTAIASAATATAAKSGASALVANIATLNNAITARRLANNAKYAAVTVPTVASAETAAFTNVAGVASLSTSVVALAVGALALVQLRQ